MSRLVTILRSVGHFSFFVRVVLALVVGFQNIFFGHSGLSGWKLVVNSAAVSFPNHKAACPGYSVQ